MSDLKVLMLGPGNPSIKNSGLGVAARNIANYLSEFVELILIEPEMHEMQLQDTAVTKKSGYMELQDEWKVAQNIAHISVQSGISPYHYLSPETTVEGKEQNNEFKQILKEHTSETLESVRGLHFDIIYAHDWTTIPAALQLKSRSEKPLVIHFHSLDFDRMAGRDRSWVYDLELEAMEAADAIVTVSNYSANILKENYSIDPGKVFPIHNGYEAYDHVKSNKKVREEIVLFVGRLAEQKGPGAFLEIASMVHEKNSNTRFVMAGDGEKMKELIESGAYQNFAHKFHMTGHLDQEKLQELYSISSVYCMPSVSEPFGLSAVEAADAGLPMVLSKQSGASEVLTAAYTCDHRETREFSERILELLANKKACKKMIELNHKALQSVSWEKTARQILEVFNNLKN